jgi:hypothetical protein
VKYRTDYDVSLEMRLKRSRTALLWAIAEKRIDKAGDHAVKAARLGRLLLQRQAKRRGEDAHLSDA